MTPPAAWQTDPGAELVQRCAALSEGLPVNPVLSAEVCWALRARGDWLVGAIAPGFVRIFLLPGGGDLWGHIPAGQQRYVPLGSMDWRFVAGHDSMLGDFQFVDLVQPVSSVLSMAAARLLVSDACLTMGFPPPAPSAPEAPEKPPVSRRGFLRAFTGRR